MYLDGKAIIMSHSYSENNVFFEVCLNSRQMRIEPCYWWHSFLDIATSFVHVILNSRTSSDIVEHLQGVRMELKMLVNSRNEDRH